MHSTTIKSSSSKAIQGAARLVALTILGHPDSRRVGEVATLAALHSGESVRLSRLTPKFQGAEANNRCALNDAQLSRTPLFIEPLEDGALNLVVDDNASTLAADGVLVHRQRTVGAAELDRGVVIELGGRVTLLLHEALQRSDNHAADDLGLVGHAPSMAVLRERIRRVGQHDITVLLRGESGSGKELVAHAIHRASERAGRELISVNMAAIPPSTAASALFGHARGAFTGAVRSSRGYFGRADGGTLFLDEIGDTPADVQVALLRALETGEVHPVGDEAPSTVDVRLVAATDIDLEAAVASGRFRHALLQRLGGYVLEVPPLRERREDVGLLLVHFLREELARIGRAHRLRPPADSAQPWLPSWLVAMAARYDWPGNVRELRNVARQLAIDWGDRDEIQADPFIERMLGEVSTARVEAAEPPPTPEPPPKRTRRRLEDITDDDVTEALAQHQWQPAAAASALGISRTSLYALMDRHPEVRTAREIGAAEIERALEAACGDTRRAASALRVSEQGLKRQMRDLGMR